MARDDYPFLKRHREAHEQLIKDIEGLAAQFAAGDLKPDKDAIAALWGWEITHIDDADRAYAAYALNKSCNAPPGTPA